MKKRLLSWILPISINRIVFVEFVADENGAVDPCVVIFAQEAVASHQVAFDKAVLLHGEEHVLGRAGEEMASWAIDRGDHLLMEADDVFCNFNGKGVFFFVGGWRRGCELGISTPGEFIAGHCLQ